MNKRLIRNVLIFTIASVGFSAAAQAGWWEDYWYGKDWNGCMTQMCGSA